MKVTRQGNILIVDLHGMRVEQARFRLETLLGSMDSRVREVRVIHGYRSGQALRDLVRGGLDAPRVKRIRPSLNDGETVLEIDAANG